MRRRRRRRRGARAGGGGAARRQGRGLLPDRRRRGDRPRGRRGRRPAGAARPGADARAGDLEPSAARTACRSGTTSARCAARTRAVTDGPDGAVAAPLVLGVRARERRLASVRRDGSRSRPTTRSATRPARSDAPDRWCRGRSDPVFDRVDAFLDHREELAPGVVRLGGGRRRTSSTTWRRRRDGRRWGRRAVRDRTPGGAGQRRLRSRHRALIARRGTVRDGPRWRSVRRRPGSGVFWTRRPTAPYDSSIGRQTSSTRFSMVAVIGNVIAGLLALSLFTATVRLTK